MKAVICPVCNGTGKYFTDKWDACHGCNGKGWVEVHEEQSIYPYYPWTITYPFGYIVSVSQQDW
jgi:hypothetical protein